MGVREPPNPTWTGLVLFPLHLLLPLPKRRSYMALAAAEEEKTWDTRTEVLPWGYLPEKSVAVAPYTLRQSCAWCIFILVCSHDTTLSNFIFIPGLALSDNGDLHSHTWGKNILAEKNLPRSQYFLESVFFTLRIRCYSLQMSRESPLLRCCYCYQLNLLQRGAELAYPG